MEFRWTRTTHVWIYKSWYWQMYRAVRDLLKGILAVVYNIVAVLLVLLHLIVELILRPIADIFKLGSMYKNE